MMEDKKTSHCLIYPPNYFPQQFSIVNKFAMSFFLQKSKILRWLPTPTSGTLSILAGLLSSVCLGTWLFSSSFYIKQIHFEGNDRISERALHHLSDIHVKTHIFSILRPANIEKIESKIEKHPWIKDVQVKHRFFKKIRDIHLVFLTWYPIFYIICR